MKVELVAMKSFNSKEEVREEKEKILEDYGIIPDYLLKYLDKKEAQCITKELFKNRYMDLRRIRDTTTREERKEYVIKKKEELQSKFWSKNRGYLIKKRKRLGSHLQPVWTEPLRSEERIEQERELTDSERRALISVCETDLYLFAIRYFPHYLSKPSSKLHKFIYNLFSREMGNPNKKRRKGLKYAIAAPRGGAKSSIVSNILPLWCACYKKKQFMIIVSDTAGQAEDFLSDIKRELEFNVALARDFPHVVGKGVVWRQNEIITKNDIKILALGTGNKIRGRKFGVIRPDLLVFDDLESSDDVRSEVNRNFIRYDWFNKDAIYVEGTEVTDFIVIGTVLGKDSLLNALLDPKEYPNWKSKRFSAVNEFSTSPLWDEWAEIYTNILLTDREERAQAFFKEYKEEMLEGTKVLWPEGDPYYDLMVNRLSDPSGFLTEKQNSPIDTTKIYVTLKNLSWFSSLNLKNERIKIFSYFGAIDPSLGKKSKKGDYSCIVTLGRDGDGFLYVIDIDLKRRSVDEQIDTILDKHDTYHYSNFAVETNAFQYVVAKNLRKKSRKTGSYVPVKDVNVFQDKKLRFEGYLPLLTDGTILFDKLKYRTNQQYKMGVDQICSFTGENDKHDDCPDALGLAVEIAKKPRFKMRVLKNKKHRRGRR